MKRVVVVGSSGQDGTILYDRLVGEGCDVLAISRRGSEGGPTSLRSMNILDRADVHALIGEWRPDEIYYLPAYHHSSQDRLPPDTCDLFQRSMDVHVTGLLHFLQAIKERSSQCRLFYAASSLIFGDAPGEAQDEQTPLNPTCVYGITKATGVQCCRLFRATHGVFSSVGILYNHESALRRETFVSQKIVQGAWRIQRGQETKLVLGDLSAEVDWGYAPDFTEAMTKILALDAPDDFVIATGELHSIREFVTIAFGCLGLDWRKHVEEDPALLGRKRSTRRGNPAKLQALCGWRPSVSFEEMIHLLIEAQRDVR